LCEKRSETCPDRNTNDEDNIVAALDSEHLDRVCIVKLDITGSLLGKIATVMQGPFPMLTHLHIGLDDGNTPVLPNGFLGGTTSCLQTIYLHGIPFPALPTLLLSASDLVTLNLRKIPPTGYISPEAMVACLATLPRLEIFLIELQLATPRPDRIRPPPPTVRIVLPALTYFQFQGASEYLEDLVAQIDGPQLNGILIGYLNQLVDFQVAQLSGFIDRSVGPKLTLFKHAHVTFSCGEVFFEMCHPNYPRGDWRTARTTISCEGIDWQVSHIAQVLSHFSATLSTVIHLKLEVQLEGGRQLNGTDDIDWLHLLRQFSTVQTLHVSRELARHIALALEDIAGEMVVQVLPSLHLVHVVGQPASSVEKFVAVRWLSGRPVTVVDTEMEFNRRLESYVSK